MQLFQKIQPSTGYWHQPESNPGAQTLSSRQDALQPRGHLVRSLCACMQGTESWERRLVEARHEHGLLEWELNRTDGASDPTQQLLSSPLPGIAALLCTKEEICARQQQLARAGVLKRVREPGSVADANTGGSAAAAAADRPGTPGDAGDAGQSPGQPRAAILAGAGNCSSHLEPIVVGLSSNHFCQLIIWIRPIINLASLQCNIVCWQELTVI